MKASAKMAANTFIQFVKVFETHRFHNLSIHYDGLSIRMTKVKLMGFLGFSYWSKKSGSGTPPLFALFGVIFSQTFAFQETIEKPESIV